METSYVDRHIRSLSLAKACVELGARIKTITYLTGLDHHVLVRLFFVDEHSARRGRPPASPEWFHQANLIEKVEASVFGSLYVRVAAFGYGPADALVGAYKVYLDHCTHSPRISFDRAFDLVCHLKGMWTQKQQLLALNVCPACHAQYLAAIGEHATQHYCPFCKLVKRYPCDKRVQITFSPRATPDISHADYGLIGAFIADDTK